jgi:hypothetical protein
MIIEVLVDLSLDFRDPLIERLEDLLPRFADKLGQATFAKPVADLRALLNQIIKAPNERLQFLLLRLGRRPGRSCWTARTIRTKSAKILMVYLPRLLAAVE